jgi:hypothetical protein
MRATRPAYIILVDLIILITQYLARGTRYEAPHYAFFSNRLFFYISSIETLCSAPCLKFHTLTQLRYVTLTLQPPLVFRCAEREVKDHFAVASRFPVTEVA